MKETLPTCGVENDAADVNQGSGFPFRGDSREDIVVANFSRLIALLCHVPSGSFEKFECGIRHGYAFDEQAVDFRLHEVPPFVHDAF